MKIAVSDCLLGSKCRFDAGHKKNDFVVDELSKHFSYTAFCPENIMLGTPRESLRLVRKEGFIDVVGNKTKKSYLNEMLDISNGYVEKYKNDEIIGFIYKSKSPSCGLERVKVYLENGFSSDDKSSGVFVSVMKKHFPLVPMEEAERLKDSWLRENFVMQLFAYKAIEDLKKNIKGFKELVDFHSSYKYLLLSKSNNSYKSLGNIVGNHEKKSLSEVLKDYEVEFKKAIAIKSSIGKTMNVLEHIYGFMKSKVSKEEKEQLFEAFKDFSSKIVPLIVPIKLLELYIKKYEIEFIKNQVFLNPYPKELALRSDIKSVKD